MFLLSQTRKLIFSTLVCLCAIILINETAVAAPGCQYMGRVYYKRMSNPPNQIYEYFTDEYWIQFSSKTSCNSPSNASATYVLSSEISSRSATGGRCYVSYANANTRGTAVNFTRTYQCPIDDYMPFVLLLMLPISFAFSRQRIIST
ncbi:hypothetical protein [Pedobacter sp. N23S346]|uniref:hypothetical protein n=1 Tax=Pedobacter sp. N23S346 TaxID=3402750 RepID=UPI003AC3877A